MKPEWFKPLKPCAGIAIWGDGDDAGRWFQRKVEGAIRSALGSEWIRTHRVSRAVMPDGSDVNSLHQEGRVRDVKWKKVKP